MIVGDHCVNVSVNTGYAVDVARDRPYTTYACREGGRVETKAYESVRRGREG